METKNTSTCKTKTDPTKVTKIKALKIWIESQVYHKTI